jgi:hypothetical protein
MAGQQKAASSTDDTPNRDFLLAEYRALVDIDAARNERLDRYLTLFLTLAASPWVLYTLILRDNKNVTLGAVPLPLALVFIVVGLLGFLVTMMSIQVRFNAR